MTESLSETVTRLKELAAKDIPGTFTSDHPEYQYVCGMLNAATDLLDVLGEFRAGDMSLIDDAIDALDSINTGMGYFVDDHERFDNTITCLRRYQAMAARMEEAKE